VTERGRSAEQALETLADLLRAEDSVISPHVVAPAEPPRLGLLAAAGELRRGEAAEYALVVEAVREGYLLHYGDGRVVAGADRDLELLAGDYLYALGLERLAGLGDLGAVRELSDLISLAAQVHDQSHPPERAAREAAALWVGAAAAIAGGSTDAHERAKQQLRDGLESAAAALRDGAAAAAASGGFEQALGDAADD
jgi:hypothetical protein